MVKHQIQVVVTIGPDLNALLGEVTKGLGVSRSAFIRRLLIDAEGYMKDLVVLVESRGERVKGSKYVLLDEVAENVKQSLNGMKELFEDADDESSKK